jgi:dimethylglycine dehydrogenase
MKSHVQVAVIGGGVIGCSVLYHLTKLGWKDVVLCERKELTAGSSWHAAGGFHALNSDINVAKLQAYTVNLYKELQAESGQDIGLHFTGGLNIAATRDRWALLRSQWARNRVLGLETELVGPREIAELCPLIDASDVVGAVWDPIEGHLDPYGATHAYAKAARLRGAEIYRHTRVLELKQDRAGWAVITDKGTIEAEHVVNAGGLWARQVGLMAGVDLPVVAMEHHYLLTDDLAELRAAPREMPLIVDLDGEIYLRQERKGVLLGIYEKDATPWAVNGTAWDYGETELLAPAMDRLAEGLEKGFRRFPSLSGAGIRKIVNGPFTFSPDGNPLVGPVPGIRNFWSACGVMAGFAQGGGVGLALAQWMIHGEPDSDVFALDVARFGRYTTRPYTIERAREFYAKRFAVAYPNEVYPAGRPSKTSAVHAQLKTANAVFGVSYGGEVPLYFAPPGTPPVEPLALRRSSAFSTVREECRASREHVGLLDISSFAKYWVTGQDAAAELDRLLAGRLPSIGRVRLAPMLSESGHLMGDLTAHRFAENEFLIGGSGYLQTWHLRWFESKLNLERIHIENISDSYGGFSIFGPQSRELLARLTDEGISNTAFPFMSARRMAVGLAPALVSRLSVTGELGYEIYVPTAYMNSVYEHLECERRRLGGGRWVGIYAVNSLRLEKAFGIWSREFSRDYPPCPTGLDRFIDYNKTNFIGKDKALEDRARGIDKTSKELALLEIDTHDADATGFEPICQGEALVGYTTSGGYGHCVQKSLAMGYVTREAKDSKLPLTVWVLGDPYTARILSKPPVDPDGIRMRG